MLRGDNLARGVGSMRFYVTKAWKQIRLERLAKDNHLCRRCKKRGLLIPATMVHHIRPLEDYPELGLELDNLISLCNTCHEQVEKRGQKYKKKKEIVKRRVRVIASRANEIKT